MDTLSIIKGNSNIVFANWALVIATMVLALITFFYMRHTRRLAEDTNRLAHETKRMADIMAQEFELKIAPFLFVDPQFSHSGQGNRSKLIQPKIYNKGFSPVYIVKIILEWWYRESPNKPSEIITKIDRFLGSNEFIPFEIPLDKGVMERDDFVRSKNLDFNTLLGLAEGRIYAIYKDREGNEYKSRVLLPLEHL